MVLVNDTLKIALCEQIAHEKYNANLYLFIAGFLKNKGLDNLAQHFLEQHGEETEHSLEFFDLLVDLNVPILIPGISEINMDFDTIVELANTYLNREIYTTTSINEIKKLAIDDDNPVVEEKMREMISKQQKEYEEATTFQDNALLCANDWWKVKVWNDSIGG